MEKILITGKESAFAMCNEQWSQSGLTMREYFASRNLAALVTKYNLKEPKDQVTICKMAVELADSLIAELNK